jgi:predicted membrane protein (TIGR00267 family)
VMGLLRRIGAVLEVARAAEFARRLALMNFFEGVTIGSGLAIGLYLSGNFSYYASLLTVLSVAVGSAISGFMGAWMAERIEQEHRLKRIEEAILADLRGTLYQRAAQRAPILVGTFNGLSAAAGVGVVAAPFLASLLLGSDPLTGAVASVAVSIASLTGVGLVLERTMRLDPVFAVKRIMAAGLATMLLVLGIDLLIGAL